MTKRTRSQNGKRSRLRGQAFEREIADWFKARGFPDARRNLQAQGGVIVGNDLKGVPWAIECKRNDHCLFPKGVKAWKQCDEDARAIKDPSPRMVIHRWNEQKEPFVLLTLSDLERIIEQASE